MVYKDRFDGRRIHRIERKIETSSESSDDSSQSQQESTEEITIPTVKKHSKHAIKDAPQSNEGEPLTHDGSKLASELTIDDLVEKVKEKLQQELLGKGGQLAQIMDDDTQRATLNEGKFSHKKHNYAKLSAAANFERDPEQLDVNPLNEGVKDAAYEDEQVPVASSQSQINEKPDKTKIKHGSEAENHGKVKKLKRDKHDTVTEKQEQGSNKKSRKEKENHKTTPSTTLEASQVDNEAVAANLESIPSPNHAGNGIFEAMNLQKTNDSYEDYVTPAKEDMFESEEESTSLTPFTINLSPETTPTPLIVLREDGETTTKVGEYDDDTAKTDPEQKAKTESMSYDDERETIGDANVTSTDPPKMAHRKPKLGTMIPKREFYTVSSPNYYGQLPTIAEKYNFNEPLPEADREHEELKPFANPPSSINGKVKLS
ncbi:uncharacterized protein LOC126911872 [Spodoptera frugiperda]|uniref:Uncharacterized protein LOC126911872 n=1 Tax=Spodoptera frugiperda TaxID=7108 RepID=A0A9R0E0X1_SPOFR|nr:uncharacterized protein LOC126911872 [Spodoptera frugiperda]